MNHDPDLQDPADRELSAALRQHATRHAAPDTLRAGLRTQLALAEARRSSRPLQAAWSARVALLVARLLAPWVSNRRRSAALGFALGLGCALLLARDPAGLGRLVDTDPAAAAVALHVRALRDGPLVVVASSDRHTVKPWFQGRLDYAPPVHDLAEQGYPLRGGRVDHYAGQTVAVLTYARREHVVEVVVRPGGAPQPVQGRALRGFLVLDWTEGGMRYTAVSDLDPRELRAMADVLVQRSRPPP